VQLEKINVREIGTRTSLRLGRGRFEAKMATADRGPSSGRDPLLPYAEFVSHGLGRASLFLDEPRPLLVDHSVAFFAAKGVPRLLFGVRRLEFLLNLFRESVP
jgi:hypothetical protein